MLSQRIDLPHAAARRATRSRSATLEAAAAGVELIVLQGMLQMRRRETSTLPAFCHQFLEVPARIMGFEPTRTSAVSTKRKQESESKMEGKLNESKPIKNERKSMEHDMKAVENEGTYIESTVTNQM